MIPSQQAQFNWNQGGSGYGASPMYDMGSLLMGNQLGSYLGFPGAMQGAMNNMFGVNAANQNASLYNNAIQAQLQGILGASANNAYGNIGSQYVNRLTQNDLLNNPLYAEQVRGNLGTTIQELQNKGLLDLENVRSQQKQATLQSLMGMLGQLFPGGLNVGGGGIKGFMGTGGQSAILPSAQPPQQAPIAQGNVNPQPQQAGPANAPAPGDINRLAQMFNPRAQAGGKPNPALAMSRNYMDQYRGMMG